MQQWRRGRGGRGPGTHQSGLQASLQQVLQTVLPRNVKSWAGWIAAAILMVVAAVTGQIAGTDGRGTGGERAGRGGVEAGPAEGAAKLVDGDSLFVGGKEVRLKGIDAPEGRQTCTRAGKSWPCGEEARRQLSRLIAGQRVICNSTETDQHGRLLGVCTAGGKELNREMVREGFAMSYGRYEAEQREAKAAGRGLWSGEFQPPREWRRDHGIGG